MSWIDAYMLNETMHSDVPIMPQGSQRLNKPRAIDQVPVDQKDKERRAIMKSAALRSTGIRKPWRELVAQESEKHPINKYRIVESDEDLVIAGNKTGRVPGSMMTPRRSRHLNNMSQDWADWWVDQKVTPERLKMVLARRAAKKAVAKK
jgi:hypothetical protein